MEIVLEITDLSRSGPGVGREASGRVVFVPFTAPGDLVRVELVEEEKRYAEGKVLEILRSSSLRTKPRCPVFGQCGGCEWQHIPYADQWDAKKRGVVHALERVGISDLKKLEEFPADRIWEYRNRVQLRGLGDSIGFYKKGSKEIVAIDTCWIARPEINAKIPEAKTEGRHRHREYKVELEVSDAGECTATWNSGHSARGFRQVHDEQNEKLRAWVAQNVPHSDVLLDLYGGRGNLSLGLAGEIHCVDVGAPSAPPPGTPLNYHFHRWEVAPWLARHSKNFSGKSVSVILDPPREGLGAELVPIIDSLKKSGATTILAIGCEADPWARMIHRMERHGWRIESVGALDFFPQTHHVEALAVLKRID